MSKQDLPKQSVGPRGTPMKQAVNPADLGFFSVLVRCGSLTAAANELGLTLSAVSKRLRQIEIRLGTTLINRTTRSMSLTPDGEIYLDGASRILRDIEKMEQFLSNLKNPSLISIPK